MALEVEFLNVGQGDSTLIKLPNEKWVLIDCHFQGDYESVLDYVVEKLPEDPNNKDKKLLDCLIITHPHEDHIAGIGKLDEQVTVKNIWESGHRLGIPKDKQSEYPHYYAMLDLIKKVKATKGSEVKELRSYKGGFNALDDDVRWYCLSPSRAITNATTDEQVHEECLVLKLEYKKNAIMFTGDSTWKTWKDHIMVNYKDDIKATILQVSHHGSITFFADKEDATDLYTEQLAEINPDIAVISVGTSNTYGHPHTKALNKYKEQTSFTSDSTQVFRTDKLGTISLILYVNNNYNVAPKYIVSARDGHFILCDQASVTATPAPDADGTYKKGVPITFKASASKFKGGATGIGKICWQRQNNGTGNDSRIHNWHQDKDSTEKTYDNCTAYEGIHDLYVKIRSDRGATMAELVHRVKVRKD